MNKEIKISKSTVNKTFRYYFGKIDLRTLNDSEKDLVSSIKSVIEDFLLSNKKVQIQIKDLKKQISNLQSELYKTSRHPRGSQCIKKK